MLSLEWKDKPQTRLQCPQLRKCGPAPWGRWPGPSPWLWTVIQKQLLRIWLLLCGERPRPQRNSRRTSCPASSCVAPSLFFSGPCE